MYLKRRAPSVKVRCPLRPFARSHPNCRNHSCAPPIELATPLDLVVDVPQNQEAFRRSPGSFNDRASVQHGPSRPRRSRVHLEEICFFLYPSNVSWSRRLVPLAALRDSWWRHLPTANLCARGCYHG
jgi:hypothetical protein